MSSSTRQDLMHKFLGSSRKPPVFFLPGFAETISSSRDSLDGWERQRPLTESFCLHSVDPYIFNNGYSIPGIAKNFCEGLRYITSKKVHLVGLSMGGAIGIQSVIDNPDLFKSLTMINSWTKTNSQFFYFHALYRAFKVLSEKEKYAVELSKKILPEYPEVFEEKERKKYRVFFKDSFCSRSSYDLLRMQFATLTWSVETLLSMIKIPVLSIKSEHDYTSVEAVKDYTSKIPLGSSAFIEQGHHAIHVEQPMRVNKLLMDFWKSI